MSKILIIEDDEGIRDIQRDYLVHDAYEVVEAGDGLIGLDMFEKESPDLVILDLNLPGLDGIEVCKRIRKSSGVPIIMVTARSKEIDELLGLDTGADDYIKKPFSPRILVSRVKALLKRPDMQSSEVITRGDLELDTVKRTVNIGGKNIDLTTIQFNILQQLVQNPGRPFQRYELIDKSYDMADLPDIFDRTMDSHIKNIRSLIEKDTRNPKYIITVRGIGYKFNENI